MVADWQIRTELLIGEASLKKFAESHILVAGLGGVGAYAAEQLARAGIGKLTLVDGDSIQPSNRNRQLLALKSSEGQFKTELMAKRLRDINPEIELMLVKDFIKDDKTKNLLEEPFDYIIDAIDSLSPKVYMLAQALQKGHKVVSSMGAGGKLDPSQIAIADISKTQHCRLAFYIRKRLRRLGVEAGFTAIYSTEAVAKSTIINSKTDEGKRSTVGTISYMPAIFGCYCASVVLRNLK
jgi:tRNA A37 threonylcarbamoyladenosine dehydratase